MKDQLLDQTWTGTATVVFNQDAVRIVSADEFQAFAEGLIPPAALIKAGVAQSDPLHGEEPDLVSFQISVLLVVQNAGDRVGENPIMGANREGLTDSRGKGLLEVEEELLNACFRLNDLEGVRLQLVETGALGVNPDSNDWTVASREYTFEAQCTADRYYHAPSQVQAANSGGTVTVTWQDPPTRFDSREVEVHRASGSTPPSSATAATKRASVALGVETFSESPGAGTWSYAVFAAYNDYAGSTNDRFSASEQGTYSTVSV